MEVEIRSSARRSLGGWEATLAICTDRRNGFTTVPSQRLSPSSWSDTDDGMLTQLRLMQASLTDALGFSADLACCPKAESHAAPPEFGSWNLDLHGPPG